MRPIRETEKTIKVSREVHTRLNVVRASRQLKTFDRVIDYLLSLEHGNNKE